MTEKDTEVQRGDTASEWQNCRHGPGSGCQRIPGTPTPVWLSAGFTLLGRPPLAGRRLASCPITLASAGTAAPEDGTDVDTWHRAEAVPSPWPPSSQGEGPCSDSPKLKVWAGVALGSGRKGSHGLGQILLISNCAHL